MLSRRIAVIVTSLLHGTHPELTYVVCEIRGLVNSFYASCHFYLIFTCNLLIYLIVSNPNILGPP